MGLALRQVEYKTLCYLTNDEWRIIEKYFPENEDGTFYVDEEVLKEAISDAKKNGHTIPEKVIVELKKAIEKDGLGINFVLS